MNLLQHLLKKYQYKYFFNFKQNKISFSEQLKLFKNLQLQIFYLQLFYAHNV